MKQLSQALAGLAALAGMWAAMGLWAPQVPAEPALSPYVSLDTVKPCTVTTDEEWAPDQTFPCVIDTLGRNVLVGSNWDESWKRPARWHVFYRGNDAGCPVRAERDVECHDVDN